jgi:hypothetical protein
MSFQDHGKRDIFDFFDHIFKHQAAAPKYSQDGKCGPNNENLLCDPKSTVYSGTCCSSYGQCSRLDTSCMIRLTKQDGVVVVQLIAELVALLAALRAQRV